MPFALVIVGLLMVVTGAKGTHAALGQELRADFTGEGNFLYWLLALGIIGAVGVIPGMQNFSRLFMTLAIVSMVLKNKGAFDKLKEAIELGPEAAPKSPDIVTASPAPQIDLTEIVPPGTAATMGNTAVGKKPGENWLDYFTPQTPTLDYKRPAWLDTVAKMIPFVF